MHIFHNRLDLTLFHQFLSLIIMIGFLLHTGDMMDYNAISD